MMKYCLSGWMVLALFCMGTGGCASSMADRSQGPVTVAVSDVRCTNTHLTMNVDITNASDVPVYYCSEAPPPSVEGESGSDGGYYLHIPTADQLFVVWCMMRKPDDIRDTSEWGKSSTIRYLAPGRTHRRRIALRLPPQQCTPWDADSQMAVQTQPTANVQPTKIHRRHIDGTAITLRVFVGYWPAEMIDEWRGESKHMSIWPSAILVVPNDLVVGWYRDYPACGYVEYDAATGRYQVTAQSCQLMAESKPVKIRLGDGR